MKIAVINSGSSSLKFKLFEMDTREVLYSVLIENIGEDGSGVKNYHDALESLNVDFSSIDAIGHRVVHGGEEFSEPTVITPIIERKIKDLIPLAPLHNGANLEGIIVAKLKAPDAMQIAVFDTAFHATMPIDAYMYAIPLYMYEEHKVRRYGFHGTSHSYLLKESSKILKKSVEELNIITLHLGNGASACAIQNGKSIDTSMGFTPLEGLVMGSRCGDIDPAILIYMQRELGISVDDIDSILNKKSGLLGICEKSDIREILNSDDKNSKLALQMMIRRVKKYIGSYMALLGCVDAIVFSGGVGENSSYLRDEIMKSDFFNNIKVLVIKTDEELEIANECLRVVTSCSK